jgi:hypothetical protein
MNGGANLDGLIQRSEYANNGTTENGVAYPKRRDRARRIAKIADES